MLRLKLLFAKLNLRRALQQEMYLRETADYMYDGARQIRVKKLPKIEDRIEHLENLIAKG